MIWTLLWGTVAAIGVSMVCVVAIYYVEIVRPRKSWRRVVRPRLWFYAEMVGPGLFNNFEHVPNYFGPGVDAVFGIDQWNARRLQSIRFDSTMWWSRDAREWLRKNRYTVARFLHVRR